MKHGGDVLSYSHLYNGQIVDYSSNINPLGPPDGLRLAINNRFDEVIAYPDIHYRKLRSEIGSYLGCQQEQIVVGNGAVDIISNLSLLSNRVVVFTPCFSEYIKRPEIFKKEIVKIPLDSNFEVSTFKLESVIKQGDMIILGNPNNPTGKRIDVNVLREIHRIVVEKGGFLVLDEAFYEFCPIDYDSIELFRDSSKICIIRAATKFFALPGIRLGYGYMIKDNVDIYNDIALPWSINTFAEITASIIFKDKGYIEKSKEYLGKQRRYMLSELKKVSNITVFDSHCNFILFKLHKYEEDHVFNQLISKGIMIRKASSFDGLDNSYIRVAVKNEENNKKLIEYLSKVMK